MKIIVKRVFCLIAIFIILMSAFFIKMYYVDERMGIIGKDLSIVIYEDEFVGYIEVSNPKFRNDSRQIWFDLWFENKKLIDYMRKNDLEIKPGRYCINQCDRFEKVLSILEFEKIK